MQVHLGTGDDLGDDTVSDDESIPTVQSTPWFLDPFSRWRSQPKRLCKHGCAPLCSPVWE